MSRNVNNKLQAFTTPPNTGSKTVGTTAITLSAQTRNLTNGVQVVADGDNAGSVYVGVKPNLTAGTADATDGFKLIAGSTVLFPVRSEADLYLIASEADQVVSFLSF